ncbi:MAG TPA: TetR-like C-terminal domain-containing protein [Gemmatimonadales bacterium]|nr:TetR-like C-terminal domain-containing protein [Gemmatimonadales bacterium]
MHVEHDALYRDPASDTTAARAEVARACRELPPGSAVGQLRDFCGRIWEILHTPTQAALYRLWVTEAPRDIKLARFYSEEVYKPIHGLMVEIIVRGIASGEFRAIPPDVAARVILAALIEQAFWCNHAETLGPGGRGGCNRVITETLTVVLGGLQPSSHDPTL